MKNSQLIMWGVTSIYSCALMAQQAYAEEEMEVTGSVSMAVQWLSDDGDTAGVGKYRDGLDDATAIEQFNIRAVKNDGFYFGFNARDVGQKDQDVNLEVGRYGLYKLNVSWNESFRNYANGISLNTEQAGDYWAVPDAIQTQLEGDFPLGTDPSDSNLLNLLAGASEVELEQQRETGTISFEFTPTEDLTLTAGYSRQTKEGLRALSTGSYERSKTGAGDFGGLGENFRLYGLELPAPINHEIDTFDLGIAYSRDNWFTDFSYRYVDFNNQSGSVTWDSPLISTSIASQGGAAINRLDLTPDYESETFSFTGGITGLPLRSRITATLSQDSVTQDDNFLAYTVNPAIVDGDGIAAATRPLPANDLDGDVTTTFVNLVLNSRPLPKTSVNLRYKSYDYESDTPRIDWDGYVRIAETNWKETDYVNRTPEYKKTRYGIDGSYRFSSKVKLKAEYAHEEYDRNDHRAASNEEDIYGATVQVNASDWALLRLGYTYQDRTINGDYTAAIEQSHGWEEAYMFDMAERERHAINAYVGLDPRDDVSIGFSATYKEDEYDNQFYGLHEAESYVLGVDLNYRPSDDVNITVYYSREDSETTQLNRTKSDSAGGGAFEVPENDWNTDIGDTTDAIGFALDAALSDKLFLEVSVDYSIGVGTFDTSNTDYLAGTTTSSATARPWSDLESEMTEVKVQLDYKWTKQLTSGVRYYYTKFDLDDFAVDGVTPYSSAPNDAQGNTMSHFIFMDANHDDYDAHFMALTLNYTFD